MEADGWRSILLLVFLRQVSASPVVNDLSRRVSQAEKFNNKTAISVDNNAIVGKHIRNPRRN
jgi:hypothetical protein